MMGAARAGRRWRSWEDTGHPHLDVGDTALSSARSTHPRTQVSTDV